MSRSEATRAERYLRFSQRGMSLALVLVLVLGAISMAMAFRPESGSMWMARSGGILAVAITIAVVMLHGSTLRGDRWNASVPEAQAIVHDEWRRTNMDRAVRVAFVVVLAAQLPFGLLMASLPSLRAVMAMGAATATLGMATFIVLYLFFNREQRDG